MAIVSQRINISHSKVCQGGHSTSATLGNSRSILRRKHCQDGSWDDINRHQKFSHRSGRNIIIKSNNPTQLFTKGHACQKNGHYTRRVPEKLFQWVRRQHRGPQTMEKHITILHWMHGPCLPRH